MKATSTTGRAKGLKPRANKKTTSAKAKKPVSAKAKRAAEANPDLVEDVVDVDIADVVDDVDPLADLVARTKEDPSAPFAPEVLAALSDLKKSDKRAFEGLRAQLKRVGAGSPLSRKVYPKRSAPGLEPRRRRKSTSC